MTRFLRFAWCLPILLVLTAGLQSVRAQQDIGVLVALEQQPGIVTMEMIADEMPIPEVHASTLVEVEGGLLAAWFGGTEEGSPDVVIWASTSVNGKWSVPREVANGINNPLRVQHPCWNPVLFKRSNGKLLLFYKVGPKPSAWWGEMKESTDDGLTWSKPVKLPEGYFGPVKNKPVELARGTLLCGSSSEASGWRVQVERYIQGRYWNKTRFLNSALEFGVIQPSILHYPDDALQILCRSKVGRVVQSWSSDNGKTWTRMRRTDLPNPNSGLDGTVLADGRAVLVYNHTQKGRSPLNVSLSKGGRAWEASLLLENEPGEFSYPAVIQTTDGMIHATYTWNRKNIRHVILDPAKLKSRPMTKGQWPR